MVVVAARGGMKGDTDKVRETTDAQAMAVREYWFKISDVDDTRIEDRITAWEKPRNPGAESDKLGHFGLSHMPPSR